jgi:D-Tyr-tRNAtyr deacylase
MAGEHSNQFYIQFLNQMKKAHSEEKIKNGVFGAMMDVSLD